MSETLDAVVVSPDASIQRVDSVGLIVDRAPAEVLREAHIAAKALQDVVSKKAKKVVFNNEQYLEFEDLQTLGRFYGVTAGQEGDSEFCNIGGADGAKAQAVAMRNGQVISRATAYCMRDEPNWASKPWFQLASMAQTRANAKVLRNVLAWVVVLAGYKATPAEEMDGLTQKISSTAAAKPGAATPAQPNPQGQPSAAPAPGVGEEAGTVEKLAARKTAKGSAYLIFTFNGRSVSAFDSATHDFLQKHENQRIIAILETKGNYTNLISARSVDAPTEQPETWQPTDEDRPY